jgi:hypothetical protein
MSILKYKSQLANLVVSKREKFKQWYRDHIDESKGHKLYEMQPPELDDIQKRIVNDLNNEGISIVNINELFPDGKWWTSLKKTTDSFIGSDDLQEYVKRFKNKESTEGFATDHYAKKYLYRKYNVDRKHEVIDIDDVFLQFGIEERMLDTVAGYLGRYPKLRMIDLWYNIAVGELAPTHSQKWHRDGEDTELVKVFLYFNDIDENAGPFTYVPNSHLKGKYGELWPGDTILKHVYGGVYPDTKELEKKFNKEQMKVCTGQTGSLIFCDTYGLHKGGHCKTKDRILGNWVYTTPSSFCENVTPYQKPTESIKITEKQKFALSF